VTPSATPANNIIKPAIFIKAQFGVNIYGFQLLILVSGGGGPPGG
jgi:hypothetical protein